MFNLAATAALIERLAANATLRQRCGWERRSEVLSESTLSRAFAEFAASALSGRVHAALIARTHEDRLVGHVSRDATAIEFGLKRNACGYFLLCTAMNIARIASLRAA